MKNYYLLLLLAGLLFFACSEKQSELTESEIIEKTFQIKIPNGYKVLANKNKTTGFPKAKQDLNIELEFDDQQFQNLKNELLRIESFKDEIDGRYFKEVSTGGISILKIDEKKKVLQFRLLRV